MRLIVSPPALRSEIKGDKMDKCKHLGNPVLVESIRYLGNTRMDFPLMKRYKCLNKDRGICQQLASGMELSKCKNYQSEVIKCGEEIV